MTLRALPLLLRRRERQLRDARVRLDAACARIRRLADANVRLSETSAGLVRMIACVAEGIGPDEPGHGERTARIACLLGRRLGLSPADTEALRMAALLHDVGRGRDGDDDGSDHAQRSADLLQGLGLPAAVEEAVRFHHERWDGQGNAEARAGSGIPLLARILGVADAVDELIRESGACAASPEQALEILQGTAGRVHDPDVVRALCSAGADEIRRVLPVLHRMAGAAP